MDLDHVDKAIVENYRKLRRRIGVLAFAFPVIVVAIGYYWGIGFQPTLSDYYYATDPVGTRIDPFPVRLWFCGILFAVGVFLYKYQGFSKGENYWLSVAGLFALGVAVFPMSLKGKSDFDWFGWTHLPFVSVHGICAVLAFLCIGVVIFRYSKTTLSELTNEKTLSKLTDREKESYKSHHALFSGLYIAIAGYMALSIGTSVVLHYMNKKQGSFILFAEWSGIWAFAAYWFVKNWELSWVAEAMKKRNELMPQKTTADIADKL
jgi:hypothetical protein